MKKKWIIEVEAKDHLDEPCVQLEDLAKPFYNTCPIKSFSIKEEK